MRRIVSLACFQLSRVSLSLQPPDESIMCDHRRSKIASVIKFKRVPMWTKIMETLKAVNSVLEGERNEQS